jgi:hypothetical protein
MSALTLGRLCLMAALVLCLSNPWHWALGLARDSRE